MHNFDEETGKYGDAEGVGNGGNDMPAPEERRFANGSMPPPPSPDERGMKPTPMMLINEISKLFHDKIRIESEKSNLQNSYRQLLFHLSHNDGCTQLDLANRTHLKAPTVSVTLQKMETDGFIRRVSDENDLRQTRVYITDSGAAVNDSMHEKFHEIEKTAVSGLSEEETKQLCGLLCRIRENELAMLDLPPFPHFCRRRDDGTPENRENEK